MEEVILRVMLVVIPVLVIHLFRYYVLLVAAAEAEVTATIGPQVNQVVLAVDLLVVV